MIESRRGEDGFILSRHTASTMLVDDPPQENDAAEDLAGWPQPQAAPSRTIAETLAAAQQFADEVAARPNLGETSAPVEDLKRMRELGIFTASLPAAYGGLGLGIDRGTHRPLLHLLAIIGGADLVLGRILEGHINALILIAAYASPSQIAQAAQDARDGQIFGVWNTGGAEPLRLTGSDTYTFRGVKTFATGAAFVGRPIVTAELEGRGWQMTLPRMDSVPVGAAISIDRGSWHPLGMEGSESFGIDFTGAQICGDDLIGAPGDFYRDPLFRGGAVRFAAVHAGAVLRLHRLFAAWLESKGRGGDPYQVARLGEVAMYAQEAVLWVERAAALAEEHLHPQADKLASERMVECANMTRVAIERLATATMQRVTAGVGAHGLQQPLRFERIVRDLTMYLRQPAPDHALAEIGRASLRKNNLRSDGAANGMWSETRVEGSLPPHYFQKIYERSRDPWNFERSEYEANKYRETLSSLPRPCYGTALEIGCSIGVFTEQLAGRCEELLSLDISERALLSARKRCAGLRHVRFECMQVPQQMPAGTFDLVVVSEVAYYWQREDLELAMQQLALHQAPGGHLMLVHYTAIVPDYPLTGDQVHELWLARPEWKPVKQMRGEGYRLDLLQRREDAGSSPQSLG